MYCYVLKLLFLTPPVVQPKSSCDVHLLRSPWASLIGINVSQDTSVLLSVLAALSSEILRALQMDTYKGYLR